MIFTKLSVQVRAIGLCREWIPESDKEMMGKESTGGRAGSNQKAH